MSSMIRGIIKNIAPCWNPGPYGMRLAAQETRLVLCWDLQFRVNMEKNVRVPNV